jgi:Xaa-Pro dipeptidase
MSFMELPFTLEEYKQRLANLRQSMGRNNINTVYLTSPENIYYFTGHRRVMPGGRWPIGIAVNKGADSFIAFCEQDEEALLMRTSVTEEAYFFGTEWGAGKEPYDVIISTLKKRNWLKGNVGVEKWTFYPCYEGFEQLISELEGAGANVIDASKVVNDIRWIKSPQELNYIKQAGKIADIGMKAAEKAIRPGATELDVLAEVEGSMYHAGGERPAKYSMVQSGHRSILQHGVSTQRVIMAGDIVDVDFCGVYQRYHADLGRTFCVGKPPKRIADAMKKAAESLKVVQKAVKPGAPLSEVSRLSKEYYKSVGVTPWYAEGYTLGIGFEPSWAGVYFHTKGYNFDPGVVTNFDHCFIFEEESLGTCVIDTLIMTESGIECLSDIQRDVMIV